jgi:2-polyprenyl-6-methoxyphenol hydroxylase-like FAD-dependent oxidoreductase
MTARTVLISGAGIAGPTLAYWLKAAGFEPTLVEHAPALRTGGYVIDFWGLGFDVAERMGLAPELDRVGYHMRELRIVDGHGARVAGFGTSVFRELTGGRFITLGRSDLSSLLFDQIKDTTEALFGDEIVALDERGSHVQVGFRRSAARRFDLVIGADGLHSKVRELAFGPEDRFERQLGYMVAAFEVEGYRPRDEQVYVMYSQPGRMLGRFALHRDRTLFLFVWIAEAGSAAAIPDLPAQKAMLRARFDDGRWETSRILAALDGAQDLYFDRVSQIRMDAWSRGRIALVGDAAFCVSLMAGQGAALAMTAAYVLAGELARADGAHEPAFQNYEAQLRTFIATKQQGAERVASAFAPKTVWGLFLRNQVVRALAVAPAMTKLAIGRDVVDRLQLPDYRWAMAPEHAGRSRAAARHRSAQ